MLLEVSIPEHHFSPFQKLNGETYMLKRNLIFVGVTTALLVIVLALAVTPAFFSQNTTHAANATQAAAMPAMTINRLKHISVVGSTQFVMDAKGHTTSIDANPYDVAIAPAKTPASQTANSLKPGDLVITNIGNNDTGMTLIRFPHKKGPGHLFNMPNTATKGPAKEAFNTSNGTNWVSNFSGNNVQIFAPNGAVLATLVNPLLNKPWGQAFNHGVHNPKDGSVASFFITNAGNATIDRIDVIPTKNGTKFQIFQIGQLTPAGNDTKIAVLWIPSLHIGGRHLSDVLLAADPVKNSIVAIPNSTTRNTTNKKSNNKGIIVFQGNPLNAPGGFTINPLNGDLLVVNENNNNLVELKLSTSKVIGVRQLDNVLVDAQTGNGSALFGVAATKDARGNLEVFFTDDNTNTLDVLSI
jgi:hypothetical protein